MKKKLLLIAAILTFFSCNDFVNEYEPSKSQSDEIVRIDLNLELKKKFSQALAKVLGESQTARELIKTEALKKFDYDFDVLYVLVKDKPLSDGNSLEGLLSKHMSNESLSAIKEKIPTLTIFVPTLPENTFSAEIWDTEKDIPYVGIRASYTNDVPVFNSAGDETLLKPEFIPIYPIVIVKESERVVANNTIFSSNNKLRSSENIQISFIDEVFDNVSINADYNLKH